MSKKIIFVIVAFFAAIIFTVLFNHDNDTCRGQISSTHHDSENLVIPIVGIEYPKDSKLIAKAPYLSQEDKMSSTVLVSSSEGVLSKFPMATLTQASYEPVLCFNDDIAEPKWQNGVNKIFTPCPQVNVGIGMANPKHKLHVNGTSLTTRLLVGSNSAMGTGSVASIFVQNNSYDILSVGKKIGAGPEQIFFKISNNGIVYTKEIWVRPTSEFPDYVFEPDYQLMTLNELENYIKSNRSLPKMPKAFEVGVHGLNLNQIQMLLVEKVEELTLHLIELHKEIELLKTKLEQQKR